MPGRRRGARTGRGWDAAPPRPRAARPRPSRGDDVAAGAPSSAADAPLWSAEEDRYRRAPDRERAAAGDSGRADQLPGATPARERAAAADLPGADQPLEPARSRERRREGSEAPEVLRDPAELAREICLRQLAVRPRTRAELATALRRRGITAEVAAEVLDRYDEVGLINDEAFARAWVTSRHHGRGLARRALAGELRQRGVDGETVGAALSELDAATEVDTARQLVQRKLRALDRAAPDAVFRRLVGLLARKGYPAGLALRVVKDALAARDAESATFAEGVDTDALADLAGESDDEPRPT